MVHMEYQEPPRRIHSLR